MLVVTIDVFYYIIGPTSIFVNLKWWHQYGGIRKRPAGSSLMSASLQPSVFMSVSHVSHPKGDGFNPRGGTNLQLVWTDHSQTLLTSCLKCFWQRLKKLS